MQGKQAKTLTEAQVKTAIAYLSTKRYALRDQAIFLLSAKAGLRAKEIASLTWDMLLDSEGNIAPFLTLEDKASKGKSGGIIPLNDQLRDALKALKGAQNISPEDYVITSERGDKMTAESVVVWFNKQYKALGFQGCSSHSGRRTFITNAARKISSVGGSLRDVQQLARHTSLQTTQRYIEGNSEAKMKIVNLI